MGGGTSIYPQTAAPPINYLINEKFNASGNESAILAR